MKKYRVLATFFAFFSFICLVYVLKPSTQLQAVDTPLACEVLIYKTEANSLPSNSQKTLVPKGDPLIPENRYLYTINLISDFPQNVIRKISVTSMAGSNEPISYIQIRSLIGPCAVFSNNQINCSGSFPFTETVSGPIEILATHASGDHPYTSHSFYIETDRGNTSCLNYNPITSKPTPTQTPYRLPAVQNLRVLGYRSVINSEYKEAVIAWDALSGAMRYAIGRVEGSNNISIGGTEETQYNIRFYPTSTWYITVLAQDYNWTPGETSDTITIEYPGTDSLPAVPYYTSTPTPTPVTSTPSATLTLSPTPLPSPTPIFDSSKMALLEQRIEELEKTTQNQQRRIGILESIITSIRNFFSRLFGFIR